MKTFKTFLFTIIGLFSPLISEGAIIINEIAWMGGVRSANHEWIELYNSGNASINVDGWVLSDNVNLNINLAGTIPAQAYVVLERTSDESSPAPAFLIYTGALVNTGATLTLRDASGQIMDQVAGGENWENIGGDNTTKDTAQYTSAGWVTDTPTPGVPNRTGRVEPVKTQSSGSFKQPTVLYGTDKPVTTRIANNSNSNLSLSLNIPDIVYVNQPTKFRAEGNGISQVFIDSLIYTWNFGDSFLRHGQEVEYSYSYPGTYVVTVNAVFAKYEETVRREVVVLPVSFSITKNESGDVQVNNDSPYDVDVSGFVVRGDKEVIFPPKTIMLPKATITIAKNRLGNKGDNLIAVYDKKGNMVASNLRHLNTANDFYLASATYDQEIYEENFVYNAPVRPISVPVARTSQTTSAQFKVEENGEFPVSGGFGFVRNETSAFGEIETESLSGEVVSESVEQTEENNLSDKEVISFQPKTTTPISQNWPYLVFIGFLTLALFGLYLGKSKN